MGSNKLSNISEKKKMYFEEVFSRYKSDLSQNEQCRATWANNLNFTSSERCYCFVTERSFGARHHMSHQYPDWASLSVGAGLCCIKYYLIIEGKDNSLTPCYRPSPQSHF